MLMLMVDVDEREDRCSAEEEKGIGKGQAARLKDVDWLQRRRV
jgi:hypothetical protein